MPIIYKIDVLNTLKEKGFNTTKLRRDKLLAESTIQQLRENKLVSWANIERLCSLLECQPGDLLEYVPEAEQLFKQTFAFMNTFGAAAFV